VVIGAPAVVFGATIVTVAFDDLAEELDVPLSTIQCVSTGCLLAMFVPIRRAARRPGDVRGDAA
jgi:hypothetical protein